MIKHIVAIVLSVVAMTWAGPSAIAANADDPYVAPARVTVTPAVIEPGGRSTIEFSPGFFGPRERVSANVVGVDGAAARVASPDGNRLLARADGGLTAIFRAPDAGRGRYRITFSAPSRSYVAIVTVIGAAGTTHDAASPTPADPDSGASVPGTPTPDGDATADNPVPSQDSSSPPDREGQVQIPGTPPEAPEWPGLDDLPWSIVLLAAIALVVTTITGTLVFAARRRG